MWTTGRHRKLILITALALAGCAPRAVQTTASPTVSGTAYPMLTDAQAFTTATPMPSLETHSPPPLNPLTGLPLEEGSRFSQRPILIKVSNFPRNNRPQWGLSFADLVFEHYAEGGLSRFSALFFGHEAETVGPIRSARLVDLELIEMYGAIFAYGSADYRVRNAIADSAFAARAVTEYPARCPPMCRYDPGNLNHLITSTRDLRTYLHNLGQPDAAVDLDGLHFDRSMPDSEIQGLELEVRYSIGNFHRWVFDPAAEAYRRWQETGENHQAEPLADRLTGKQLAAANVILVLVPHSYVTQTPEFIRIELEGSGRALAFRDGRATEIRWRRPQGGGVLKFETEDGAPYGLRPGTTWIEMVNTSAEVEERAEGAWWVRNHLP